MPGSAPAAPQGFPFSLWRMKDFRKVSRIWRLGLRPSCSRPMSLTSREVLAPFSALPWLQYSGRHPPGVNPRHLGGLRAPPERSLNIQE